MEMIGCRGLFFLRPGRLIPGQRLTLGFGHGDLFQEASQPSQSTSCESHPGHA